MLSFPAAIKVYLCTVPCDMRRSFDGLSMLAEHLIQCNPFLCGGLRYVAGMQGKGRHMRRSRRSSAPIRHI